MLFLETPAQLAGHAGKTIGPSRWLEVPQQRIAAFAEATDDYQWIHLDDVRAQQVLGHAPVAHGYLTLSLLAPISYELIQIEQVGKMINYGLNKLRFITPVLAGDRVRASMTIARASVEDGFVRAIYDVTMDVEGKDKPALAAQSIILYFDKE